MDTIFRGASQISCLYMEGLYTCTNIFSHVCLHRFKFHKFPISTPVLIFMTIITDCCTQRAATTLQLLSTWTGEVFNSLLFMLTFCVSLNICQTYCKIQNFIPPFCFSNSWCMIHLPKYELFDLASLDYNS